MKKEAKAAARPARAPKPVKPNHTHAGEAGAIAGEIIGGIVGSAAGPVGTVAGMVFGAVAGGLAGGGLDASARADHDHQEELDEEIGVIGGDLGAAKPGSPKSQLNAPSRASSGVSVPSGSPAEGPIQDLDDDA